MVVSLPWQRTLAAFRRCLHQGRDTWSLLSDQQVTPSPKNLSPNMRCGGVSALVENTCSFQEMSLPWQRHLVLIGGIVSTFSSASDTEPQKLKSQPCRVVVSPKVEAPSAHRGLSPPFHQQVTLSPKNLSPNFGGVVSPLVENTFCSSNGSIKTITIPQWCLHTSR